MVSGSTLSYKNRTKHIATFSLTNIGIVYFANNGNYPYYSSTSRIYFESKFSKVATTRGWSKWKILHQYVFRNTFPLLVPQVPRVFTLVLTQCMLVETALGWPGIGRWLINAVNEQDYNSIAAGVIVIGVCIILIDTFTKIFTFILDPFKKKGWYAR